MRTLILAGISPGILPGLAALVVASASHAETPLEAGFAGAIRGCESWVLDKSWMEHNPSEGFTRFRTDVGLGDRIGLVEAVPDLLLPPPGLRVANLYWRINATERTGLYLIVSNRLPFCHITGGGADDLKPAIDAVVASDAFTTHWRVGVSTKRGAVTSTSFTNAKDPLFSLIITRPDVGRPSPTGVQIVATAFYAPEGGR